MGLFLACRCPKQHKTLRFEDHQAAFPAKLCLSVPKKEDANGHFHYSRQNLKVAKSARLRRSLFLVRIEFRSDGEAGGDHKMMILILPGILVPLRRNIGALMIGKERQICDLDSLSQIL